MLLLRIWAGNRQHNGLLTADSASGTWARRVAQTWPAACEGLSSNAFFTASEVFTTISSLCYSALLEALISGGYCWVKWYTNTLNEISASMQSSPSVPLASPCLGRACLPSEEGPLLALSRSAFITGGCSGTSELDSSSRREALVRKSGATVRRAGLTETPLFSLFLGNSLSAFPGP